MMPGQFEKVLYAIFVTKTENPRDFDVKKKLESFCEGIDCEMIPYEHNLSIASLMIEIGIKIPDHMKSYLKENFENQSEEDKSNFINISKFLDEGTTNNLNQPIT